MRRVNTLKPCGTWSGEPTVSVTLAFDERYRRRMRMNDDTGEAFMLELPDAVLLADGDGLELDDGSIIVVRAAHEPVADIKCRDAAHAARIAWHIGNRHTAIEVLGDGALRIADDHVLVAMVEGLGAQVERHDAPFQPEPGAYGQTDKHAQEGGHGHHHS